MASNPNQKIDHLSDFSSRGLHELRMWLETWFHTRNVHDTGGGGTTISPATTVVTETAFGQASAVGTGILYARNDHTHGSPATPVTSLKKTGSAALTGAVTLTGGTNITLTQAGQDITIAAPATALRKCVFTWTGYVPFVTGNGIVIVVPYKEDGSSWSFTLQKAKARIETPSTASTTAFRIERSAGGNAAFSASPVTVTTFSLASSTYEDNETMSVAIVSGDLLRLVHTNVGAFGSAFCIEIEGTE